MVVVRDQYKCVLASTSVISDVVVAGAHCFAICAQTQVAWSIYRESRHDQGVNCVGHTVPEIQKKMYLVTSIHAVICSTHFMSIIGDRRVCQFAWAIAWHNTEDCWGATPIQLHVADGRSLWQVSRLHVLHKGTFLDHRPSLTLGRVQPSKAMTIVVPSLFPRAGTLFKPTLVRVPALGKDGGIAIVLAFEIVQAPVLMMVCGLRRSPCGGHAT